MEVKSDYEFIESIKTVDFGSDDISEIYNFLRSVGISAHFCEQTHDGDYGNSATLQEIFCAENSNKGNIISLISNWWCSSDYITYQEFVYIGRPLNI